MQILIIIVTFFVSLNIQCYASKYDEARELYKLGPSQANKIIELLQSHLVDEPKDITALKLLGITQFGVSKPKEALENFETVIDLTSDKNQISASMLMYKARSLYELDRKAECRHILQVYWAFWQDDGKLQGLYDYYWPEVKDERPPKD